MKTNLFDEKELLLLESLQDFLNNPVYVIKEEEHDDEEILDVTELLKTRAKAKRAFDNDNQYVLEQIAASSKYINDPLIIKYIVDSGFTDAVVAAWSNPHITEETHDLIDDLETEAMNTYDISKPKEEEHNDEEILDITGDEEILDITGDEELLKTRAKAKRAFDNDNKYVLEQIAAESKYINDPLIIKYIVDSGFTDAVVAAWTNPHITEETHDLIDDLETEARNIYDISENQKSLFMSFKTRTLSEQIKRMVMEELNNILIEGKKDACYNKVKSRYKKWPSAYASGALVKCRKVGAKNWGNSVKEYKQKIPGGLTSGLKGNMKDAHEAIAKKHGVPLETIESQIEKGIKVELEHTTSKKIAHEIAMDHVWEDPEYYDKLSKIEEAKKKAGTESSKEKNLRDWFKRKGAKGKTGGWVDCNTCKDGKCKPCGRQKGESRAKYPACRPTPGACKEKGRGKTWGKTSKKTEG